MLAREEGQIQKSVYYVSRVLKGSELNYTHIEKLAYALLIAMRKFRVYLLGHLGAVSTDTPLRRTLQRPSIEGRITVWAVEIGGMD